MTLVAGRVLLSAIAGRSAPRASVCTSADGRWSSSIIHTQRPADRRPAESCRLEGRRQGTTRAAAVRDSSVITGRGVSSPPLHRSQQPMPHRAGLQPAPPGSRPVISAVLSPICCGTSAAAAAALGSSPANRPSSSAVSDLTPPARTGIVCGQGGGVPSLESGGNGGASLAALRPLARSVCRAPVQIFHWYG